MLIQELLKYVEATFLAFLVNIIPAFAPPTWILLSIFEINNPNLNSFVLALFGVIGSVSGRFVMYLYSTAVGKYVPQKQADNLNYFKKFMMERRLGVFLGTFVYSLSPLPSNFLFIAFGISRAKVLPVLVGFALGRLVSYSILVYLSLKASIYFDFLGMANVRHAADLLGIIGAVSIIFIDWKKVDERTLKKRSMSEVGKC